MANCSSYKRAWNIPNQEIQNSYLEIIPKYKPNAFCSVYIYSIYFPDEKANFREAAKTTCEKRNHMNHVPFILVEDK